MNIMLVHSSSKNFSMLRREDFKIIGDVASNYEFFLYNDFFAVNVSSISYGINKQFDIMQRCRDAHSFIKALSP